MFLARAEVTSNFILFYFIFLKVEKVLQGAVEYFQQAKTYLERILHNQQPAPNANVTAEVKTLLRVCACNFFPFFFFCLAFLLLHIIIFHRWQ
jgi:hypothetical protein